MQFRILNIILLACCAIEETDGRISATGDTTSSLECFECTGDECNSINDSMLNYCGPQDTTASPAPTPSTTTTMTNTPNVPPSVTTKDTTSGTTEGTTSGTTEGTTSGTTKGTTSGTTKGTTSGTTEGTTSVTTKGTTSGTTESTTSETTSKTTESTKSSTVSTTDDITETITTSTSLPTEISIAIEETSPPTQGQNALIQSKRQRRSLATNVKILPADVLLANYRSRTHNGRAESSYYCYSASIPDGDSSKQKLGCVKVAADQEPCDAVRELNDIPTNTDTNYYCHPCQTDKCNNNGAAHFQGISMLTLLAIVIVQKFCKY